MGNNFCHGRLVRTIDIYRDLRIVISIVDVPVVVPGASISPNSATNNTRKAE